MQQQQQLQLVDLVKPGPSGTVASTAAVATAAHAALITAAPDIAPAGLLATVPHQHQQRTHTTTNSISTVMQDLVRAAEKALASGLGDWHLQSIQDVSPEFEQRVLMGALGPEALKHTHRLPEAQILHIYGLLHRHCTGFQQEVQAAVAGAEHREQLLACIWTAFAQLWDECVQVTFQGEVLAAIDELQSTYASLLDTQDALAAVQQENSALKDRCAEFVRTNLDHMLAWRALKAKADALEGEVAMLSSANNEISLRAAATNSRNTQLTVQLEGLGARLSGAEQQIQDREVALAAARTALLEKDSGLRQLEAQVAALGQQLGDARQDGHKQDSCISDLERQLQHKQALVQDAERRVADKQRAFNLLHADFAKQKAEAVEAVEVMQKLQKQLSALQQQLSSARQEAATANSWRQRWSTCRMEVEDLSAANNRAMLRRHELVASYWPVMARLNAAEDAVAALTRQVVDLGQAPAVQLAPRDTRAAEVEGLDTDTTNTTSSSSSSGGGGGQQGQQQQTRQLDSGSAVREASSSGQQQAGDNPAAAAAAGTQAAAAAETGALAQGVHAALQEELQQLRSSYLLLQEEYWRQKERLMTLDFDKAQLTATADAAAATAAQATADLAAAQASAQKEAAGRVRLEADLAGCRSWIRDLEKTEQQYLKTIREQGALEQAALAAQRQAHDLRSRLAEAQAGWQRAQAAADGAQQERTHLLQQFAQELNKASLVEQALQQLFKQEVTSGRARCLQLQDVLHQRSTDLEAARLQLTAAQQQRAGAEAKQRQLQLQLEGAQRGSQLLQQQVDKAQSVLVSTLQRLEDLEGRVSLVSSSSLSLSSSNSTSSSSADPSRGGCRTMDVAIEAALHMLERLLVSLQCLAADAATISNASNASKVEVLVGGLMQGLEAAAASGGMSAGRGSRGDLAGGGQQQQQQQMVVVGQPPSAAATSLVLLRNVAGAAGKQRCQELERQLSTLQLQLGDTSPQLVAAASANARLQRVLNLKTRAVASLERQLAAAECQVQQLQASQAYSAASLGQMQQELAAAHMEHAQLAAQHSSRAGELQAVQGRVSAAESASQQLQAAAAAAEASSVALSEQLQQALEAARREAMAAAAAAGQQAAAVLQAEQLQQQLTSVTDRVAELEQEMRECRMKTDISCASARDAEYLAAEARTTLVDTRRELEVTQRLLQLMHEGRQQHQQQEGRNG